MQDIRVEKQEDNGATGQDESALDELELQISRFDAVLRGVLMDFVNSYREFAEKNGLRTGPHWEV